MKDPATIETKRLLLRKPTIRDAALIFSRYARDPVVTRFMSWATHRSVADTNAFVMWAEADWERWPAGSYLIFSRETESTLLGGTGLSFKAPDLAITGYILAQDAWGFGYATEACRAMVDLGQQLGVKQLEAECHVDHRASARVLEKAGFVREAILCKHTEFPNLAPGLECDVLLYGRNFCDI